MKNCQRGIFIIFFLVSCSTFAQTQNIRINQFTEDNGLSNNLVHCIYQDNLGFIWFGTENGLNRFDGYDFKVYKYNQKDINSLSNNIVYSLIEDQHNDLWIGTNQGLNKFDRKQNRIIKNKNWPQGAVKAIAVDKADNLWVGTYQGAYFLDFQNDKITNYLVNPDSTYEGSLSSSIVTSIHIDGDGNVWIGTPNGLNLFDEKTNSFINYYHVKDDTSSLIHNEIKPIIEDSQGRLWIGTMAGLDLFVNSKERPEKAEFIHFKHLESDPNSIINGSVRTLFIDKKNKLWAGSSRNGLSVLDLNTFDGRKAYFKHYTNNSEDLNGLSYDAIHAFLEDKHNNYWISVIGEGIKLIKANPKNFSQLKKIPGDEPSLSRNVINAIIEDGNDIWIGTSYGLNKYNKELGTIKNYFQDQAHPSNIFPNSIHAICQDRRGVLWFGGWSSGLNSFDPKAGLFKNYTVDPNNENSISNNNIYSILEDTTGIIWIATMGGGINSFDPLQGTFSTYQEEEPFRGKNYSFSITETSDKDLWFGFTDGLVRYNPNNNQYEAFYHDVDDSSSLSSDRVYSIFEDSKENIWICTDAGLNVKPKSKKGFIKYMESDGLPDNSISGILEDSHGNLWVSTSRGLAQFVDAIAIPNDPIFKKYTADDGVQSKGFRQRSCFSGADGMMYFGGDNGMNMFYPDSIMDNPVVPDVVITDFTIFSLPVEIGAKDAPLKQDISLTSEIVLTHKQQVFSFKFTALNFISPEKNQYAYYLEGFDPEHSGWDYVENKREVTYMNLKPGDYIFRVKASNNDGIWNEEGVSIKITILPPWWGTWWFRISIIFLVIGMLVLFFYLRTRSLRYQKTALEKKVKERTLQLNKLINELQEKQDEVETTNEELTATLEDLFAQKNQVDKINHELKQTKEELETINEQLDKRVQERTSKLVKANQELDRFVYSASHDLSAPLKSIIGLINIVSLERKKVDLSNHLRHMEKSVRKLEYVIQSLTQYSRNSGHDVRRDNFYFYELIEDVLEESSYPFPNDNIRLIKDYSLDQLLISDYLRLKIIMSNLISNSLKYQKIRNPNAYIQIGLKIVNDNYTIVIKDNGVGINPEYKDKIFQMFYRATVQSEGSGLGLYIVKETVEKLRGEIKVDSVLNEYTEISIVLPKSDMI